MNQSVLVVYVIVVSGGVETMCIITLSIMDLSCWLLKWIFDVSNLKGNNGVMDCEENMRFER